MTIGDLVETGTYPFHSRFNRAVNFTDGHRLISVVDETIGDGPLNIVLRDFEAGQSRDPLRVFTDEFIFDGRKYPITARYSSVIPGKPRNLSRFDITAAPPKSLAFLLDASREQNFRTGFERKFVEHVKYCVRQIFHGDQLAGVRALRGSGLGLTPSGDDFIAGHLIGLNLRGEPTDEVFEAARSDNIFSNTFLDLARQGRVFGRMKNLILALIDGRGVRECAERLFAVGGTSGADLATGFLMTMMELKRRGEPPRPTNGSGRAGWLSSPPVGTLIAS
jgi:hypothetical protein